MERKPILLRLPVGFEEALVRYAQRQGVSRNLVITWAVNDFLAKVYGRPVSGQAEKSAPVVEAVASPGRKSGKALPEPAGGRNALCPCGSGKKWKVCCR